MQDCYVGDIGDFANNGLLRYLCGVTGPSTDNPLRVGVVSYLNESQSEGAAGNKIGYLNISEYNARLYRECDPVLYDTLQRLVGQSLVSRTKRNIDQISCSLFLSDYTKYYNDPVPNKSHRYRKQWLERALADVKENTDILFLNPDNGIDLNGKYKLQYMHLWEIVYFFDSDKSLVIYHHLGQGQETYDARINNIVSRLNKKLKPEALWVVTWHRVSTRAYFIVAKTKEHRDKIKERLDTLDTSPWKTKGHFSVEEF